MNQTNLQCESEHYKLLSEAKKHMENGQKVALDSIMESNPAKLNDGEI